MNVEIVSKISPDQEIRYFGKVLACDSDIIVIRRGNITHSFLLSDVDVINLEDDDES